MHNGIVNKTRYDDLRKQMKQTSFTVKNLPEKQFTIVKRSFKFSIKPLSLDSTIPVDELTAEIFYRFRTFELFNIWTPTFCTDPSTWLTPATWRCYWLQSSSLHQQWISRSTWLQNPRCTYSKNLLPLQNIWTLQYMNATLLHESYYVTNSSNLKMLLVAKFFTSSTMRSKKHLVTKL